MVIRHVTVKVTPTQYHKALNLKHLTHYSVQIIESFAMKSRSKEESVEKSFQYFPYNTD